MATTAGMRSYLRSSSQLREILSLVFDDKNIILSRIKLNSNAITHSSKVIIDLTIIVIKDMLC